MARFALLALPLLLNAVAGLQADLSDANFKKVVEGKNAFLFFQAPW